MAYTFNRAITIQGSGQVPSTQTNFPVLVSGTYTYLKTVGNGGNVQSSSGYDIIFTSDSAGLTALNFERAAWDGTSGVVQFWVLIPSLTATTVFYIWYGNAAITTDQQNKTGTWNANYKGVYHYEVSSGSAGPDSTASPNDFTVALTASTSPIIGRFSTWGGGSYEDASSSKCPTGANPWSIEAWVRWAGLSNSFAVSFGGGAAGQAAVIQYDGAGHLLTGFSGGQFTFTPTIGVWYHICATYDGTLARGYVNGAVLSPATFATTLNITLNGTLSVARACWYNLGFFLTGDVDEMRISNSQRSADWITTSYNNQNAPSSFYSIASAGSTGAILVNPGMDGGMARPKLKGGMNG